jgi:anti-sigma factor RsiW
MMRKAKGLMFRNIPMMINCREFEDFMIDYFEGSLPKQQRRVFEFHLKVCRECRDYLAAYRRTIEVSKHVFADADAQVPDDVPEDLVRAILDARAQ